LNEIEDTEITFLRIDRKDKVQGRVVTVDEFHVTAPIRDRLAFEVVTETVRSRTDLLKNTPNDLLLGGFAFDGLVEFSQPGVAVVVHDDNALDHCTSVLVFGLEDWQQATKKYYRTVNGKYWRGWTGSPSHTTGSIRGNARVLRLVIVVVDGAATTAELRFSAWVAEDPPDLVCDRFLIFGKYNEDAAIQYTTRLAGL
jgi:hypothetical protein